MNLEVQSYDGSTFQEKKNGSSVVDEILDKDEGRGSFDVWPGGQGFAVGFFPGRPKWAWLANNNAGRDNRAKNWYPHDVQEKVINTYLDAGYPGGDITVWKDWLVHLPPVGEPDGELEPFSWALSASRRSVWGAASPEDPPVDIETYNPPHPDESHPENADYFWKKLAWLQNWWLGFMPLTLSMSQQFMNDKNWLWANEQPGEDNEQMWQYFGLGWNGFDTFGMGKILADPDNPK